MSAGTISSNLHKILGGIFGVVVALAFIVLITFLLCRKDKGYYEGCFLLVFVLIVLLFLLLSLLLILLLLVLGLLLAYINMGFSHDKFRLLTPMKRSFDRVALPCQYWQ